jgi:hypothetical protein
MARTEKRPPHASPALPASPFEGAYKRYDIKDLLLDPKNPRLIEYLDGQSNPSQDDLLKILFERMAVEEVAMSIAYNGYFNHEPLILQKGPHGSFTTIEGNRRLAAVRLLLSAELRKMVGATDLPDIDAIAPSRRNEISHLPGLESTRKDMWEYLGFKHVNGPSTWGAYAKAQYVAEVHNDYKVPLDEIARQIGDYSNTVERQYRGLMVIEQAEKEGLFKRENTTKGKFPFNYIYTALENENFRDFLGLDEKKRDNPSPVPKQKLKHLGELLLWLYGDKERDIPSVIKSQNPDLRILGATLTNEKGAKALRERLPLAVAHDISLGDEQIFRTAIHDAKTALQRAHATLTTGFDSSDRDAKELAIELERLATDLVDQMEQKQRRGVRPVRARSRNA